MDGSIFCAKVKERRKQTQEDLPATPYVRREKISKKEVVLVVVGYRKAKELKMIQCPKGLPLQHKDLALFKAENAEGKTAEDVSRRR